jgi:hypothetical protein
MFARILSCAICALLVCSARAQLLDFEGVVNLADYGGGSWTGVVREPQSAQNPTPSPVHMLVTEQILINEQYVEHIPIVFQRHGNGSTDLVLRSFWYWFSNTSGVIDGPQYAVLAVRGGLYGPFFVESPPEAPLAIGWNYFEPNLLFRGGLEFDRGIDPANGRHPVPTYLDSITFEEAVPSVPGDATGDGLVNVDDLNAVRNNFGAQQQRLGDADTNGVVNINDLNAVRNNFGAGQPAAVPEPSTYVLATISLIGMAGVIRQRKRR